MCLALVPGWGWVEGGGCPARPRVIAEAEVKVHSEPFLQAPLEMEVSATDDGFLGGGGQEQGWPCQIKCRMPSKADFQINNESFFSV